MKKLHFILLIVFSFPALFGQTASININTKTGNILYNDTLLIMEIYDVTALLGEPERREIVTHKHEITEQNADGYNPVSYQTQDTEDEYLVYDSLGLVFCKETGNDASGKLTRVIIFFNTDREFKNRTICEFEPENTYKGSVFINGEKLLEKKQLIPYQVNATTESFPLFSMNFSPTLYKTDIDMIYSRKSNISIEFYIDNPMDRKAAALVLKPEQ